jgi:hypothetical protein
MFFVPSSSPELIEMLKAVLACYVSVASVIGLYISRFYGLLRGREFKPSDELLQQQGSEQASVQTSKLPSSSQSHAHAERESLIATRTQLRAQIVELRNRLQKIGVSAEASTSEGIPKTSAAPPKVRDPSDPYAQFVSYGSEIQDDEDPIASADVTVEMATD